MKNRSSFKLYGVNRLLRRRRVWRMCWATQLICELSTASASSYLLWRSSSRLLWSRCPLWDSKSHKDGDEEIARCRRRSSRIVISTEARIALASGCRQSKHERGWGKGTLCLSICCLPATCLLLACLLPVYLNDEVYELPWSEVTVGRLSFDSTFLICEFFSE